MNTNDNSTYANSKLESYVTAEIQKIQQHSIIDAEHNGKDNIPHLLMQTMRPYFHEFHMRFQAIIDKLGTALQSRALRNEVAEHEKVTSDHAQRVNNQLYEVKQQQASIDTQLQGKQPPYSIFRLIAIWVVTISTSLFDSVFAMPFFESLGFSLLEAAAMGVLFAVALAAFAHLYRRLVYLGKTGQRKVIFAVLCGLAIGLFAFLAQARAAYFNHQIAATSVDAIGQHISAMAFFVISIVFFMVAVAVNYLYFPTGDQRDDMRTYNKLLEEKAANADKQQQLIHELQAQQAQHSQLRIDNLSKYEYGFLLERQIISQAAVTLQQCKNHNARFRPDHGRPTAFETEGYPFEFVTNFQEFKKTT
jgi:hypothetical protein